MAVTEVNNKNWLKTDPSRMEEKLTRKQSQSLLQHHYNENWHKYMGGPEGLNTTTSTMDHVRNKTRSQPESRDRIWHHKVQEQSTFGDT